jgi:hypothetical protein
MDSINDILLKKDLDEPAEVAAVKRYVELKFKSTVGVIVHPDRIIILTPSAALANTIRLNTVDLQKTVNTDKKLVFRIGR